MNILTKNIKLIVLLIFTLVGFFIYSNSFSNELFWDDDDGIINNIYIKDWSYLPNYFSENLIAGSGQISNYWRPLVLVSFASNYSLSGLDPASYHITNLLIHVLAAWLGFLLIYSLTHRLYLSFFPAFLFLIHPLQTEAVTYVSGIADPLSTVFILSSLFFYVLFRQKKNIYLFIVSILAFVLSLLSKEQSVTLPALVFIIEFFFFFKKDQWRQSLSIFLPFLFVAMVYVFIRINFLNFNDLLTGVNYSTVYDSSLKVRLLTFTYVFVKYLELLFLPFNLHMAYEVTPIKSFFSWSVLEFFTLIFLFIFLIKKYWHQNKLLVFSLFWFFLLLLPRTNIISINRPLYEHWLYLPMLGFWLAVFILIDSCLKYFKVSKLKIKIIFICLLILFFSYFSFLTIKRNTYWRDPITFYENNLKYTPNSFIQHNNLGMAYANSGQVDRAIKEYRLAISIKDIYPQVHYNLANALQEKKLFNEAKEEYKKSLKISPSFIMSYNSLIFMAIRDRDLNFLEETLEKMRQNIPEKEYLLSAFFAYYYYGDVNMAGHFSQIILTKYPENSDIGLMMLRLK